MNTNFEVGKDYMVKERNKPGGKSHYCKPKKMKLVGTFPKFLLFENRVAGGTYNHTISTCDLLIKRAVIS